MGCIRMNSRRLGVKSWLISREISRGIRRGRGMSCELALLAERFYRPVSTGLTNFLFLAYLFSGALLVAAW